jgi:AcrR family transcriptional regulator
VKRPSRQTATKSERTRERILDAAAKTFREKGYAGTRLADIAAAADTQAGSLYYHFDSKNQLLDEVLERGTRRVFAAVRERVEGLPAGASGRERLLVAVEAHLSFVLKHDDYASANIRLFGQTPAAIRRRHIRKHRVYAAYWQDLLVSAQAAGEIRADVDLSLARLNLFGMMNWSLEWYRPSRLDIRALAKNMCDTLLDGITAASGGGAQRPR